PEVMPFTRLTTLIPFRRHDPVRPLAVGDARPRLGIDDIPCHFVDEFLERMGGARAEEPSAIPVSVQVQDPVLPELFGVRFHPLPRSDQARFLSVPRAVDNRPLRLPAALHERTCGLRLRHQSDETAQGVLRAVYPGVMMIAADNPLVGPFVPFELP